MLHVKGQIPLVPAIMVGWESRPFVDEPELLDREQYEPLPHWLVQIDHQVGGYATYPKAVFGCVLRLDSNKSFAVQDPDFLINLLRLKSDSTIGISSDREETLFFTHGDLYKQKQLEKLSSLVQTNYFLPEAVGGCEGIAVLADEDPLKYLKNWKMTSFCLDRNIQSSDWWPPKYYRAESATYVSELKEGFLLEDTLFDKSVLEEIEDLSKYRAEKGKPKMYLIWQNSD